MSLSFVSIAYVGSGESLLHQHDKTGPLWPGPLWPLLSPYAVGEWAVRAITCSLLKTGSCTLLCIFNSLPSE